MSFSDEGSPEEVTPEPQPEGEDSWSDADSAALAAESADPADGPDDESPGEVDPLKVLASERDEYLAALQRTQADFENYRKRVTRLQEEQAARASSDLVNKLLPVLDTLDLAQAHQSEAESDDAKALTAARSMLLDLLAKEGLERVDQAEVPFDPSMHDAVARTEGDEGGKMLVDEVLRSGYRWKGQVLRPAMVRVRG
jgi:molecular chaperone GrpE